MIARSGLFVDSKCWMLEYSSIRLIFFPAQSSRLNCERFSEYFYVWYSSCTMCIPLPISIYFGTFENVSTQSRFASLSEFSLDKILCRLPTSFRLKYIFITLISHHNGNKRKLQIDWMGNLDLFGVAGCDWVAMILSILLLFLDSSVQLFNI